MLGPETDSYTVASAPIVAGLVFMGRNRLCLGQRTRKRTQLQHFLKKLLFKDSFWDSVRANGHCFIFFEDFFWVSVRTNGFSFIFLKIVFETVNALTDTASYFLKICLGQCTH